MKTSSLGLIILTLTLTAGGSSGSAFAATKQRQSPLKTIVLSMGQDGKSVIDPRYNSLFKQGDAATGVADVIRNGQFFINGFALPGTEAAFQKTSPAGFLVNQTPWLAYDNATGTWKGGYKASKPATSYDAAALQTASGIVAGLEVRLYDDNADGYADRIDADYKEGVLVGQIKRGGDETYAVQRADIGPSGESANEGRAFDGARFIATSGERIKARNLDKSIAPYDVALFWYGPDGWKMQRAKEVRGALLGGADHENYNIDGKLYQDAMRFSRDNVPIANRPGEYVNAQKYFDFDKAADGPPVSLWLVPTTNSDQQGAPVALTSGASARAFLEKAIAYSDAKLRSVSISVDGADVPTNKMWVSEAANTQLKSAIERARAVLAAPDSRSASLDYQLYLLYLNLEGSDKDIGAKFGGFRYVGFAHEMKPGSKATTAP